MADRYWAVYVRVSTQEQSREGVSLDAQEEKCRLALQLEMDGEEHEVRVFREEGESGKSLERPRILELLAEVERGRVFGVICFNLDRLSRSIIDFHKVFALCELHGTKILSVSQKFDTSTPTGRLCLNILMCFAQFEREAIADRITTAVRHLRSGGHWTGGQTPYGYTLARDAEGRGVLVQDAKQAGFVRRMFEMVLETRSLSGTARILRRAGLERPSGLPLNVATVDRMIRNRTYIGEIRHKVTRKINGKSVVAIEYVKGRHEPIVTKELFDAVAKVAYKRTKQECGSRLTNRVFPLQGLLHCSSCRQSFSPHYTFHKGRKTPYTHYYRCLGATKHRQDAAHCPFHTLNANQAEHDVIEVVRAIAHDRSGWLNEICERLNTTDNNATQHLQQEQTSIREELRQTKAALENVTSFVRRAGTSAPTGLINDIKKLERTTHALQTDLDHNIHAIQTASKPSITPEDLRGAFTTLTHLLHTATPTRQQELLRLFIHRIDVTQDGLVLHVYPLPQNNNPLPDGQGVESSKTSLEWWR